MKGKAKCKALKEIRRQIAEQNDIPYAVSQCTYQGDCKGTCPKCEAELKYLERELAIRQGLGKAVAVAGISMSVCTSLTACGPIDALREAFDSKVNEQTSGALPAPPEALDGVIATPETTVTLEGDVAMPETDVEGGLIIEEDPPTETIDGGNDDDDCIIGEEVELAGDIAPVE